MVILLYAGRLPGPPDFPEANVGFVRDQVDRLILNLRPRLVVGSAAAGADLLVLGAALKSGAHAKVVLAGNASEFEESSVSGRGAEWESLFNATLNHPQLDIIEVNRHTEDDASYEAVTALIGELADSEAIDDEAIVCLSVSAKREGLDHSANLAAAQDLRGRLVLWIDPARSAAETPSAFVAMPFGRRKYPEIGWQEYEADETYRRILLPGLIGAGFRPIRADAEALLEVIDLTMLKEINSAEVLIADLATLNPNVMWEVGVRHAWRRAGTILLRPSGSPTPFNVSHARVHEYSRDEKVVTDHQAVLGIQLLGNLLSAVPESKTDSPAFLTLPSLSEARVEDELPNPSRDTALQRMQEISLAADLRDGPALDRLSIEIMNDPVLEQSSRSPLLEQVGMALIALARHADAAQILAPLAEADSAMNHVRLQQQYAHALIRAQSPDDAKERLEVAELRLRALLQRMPSDSETWALLGSVAKARLEAALAAGEPVGSHLDLAIDAYMRGFRRDPGAYHPGLVALALYRLRGQHLKPNAQDLEAARDLFPVVRFAATRLGGPTDDDVWRLATVAELNLHGYLLDQDDQALVEATALYARVAAAGTLQQRVSATRQLRLFEQAGDPAVVLGPLMGLLGDGVT